MESNGISNSHPHFIFTLPEDRVSEESPLVTPLFATQPVVDEERVLLQKRQEKMPCEPQTHSRDAKGKFFNGQLTLYRNEIEI